MVKIFRDFFVVFCKIKVMPNKALILVFVTDVDLEANFCLINYIAIRQISFSVEIAWTHKGGKELFGFPS